MRKFRKKKIGIALGGGAARALSHIGVIEVLEELGVEISAVSGTSMGAVVGSLYCSGVSIREIKNYVSSMDWRSFLLFSDITLHRFGIINGRKVEEVLDKFLGDKTFGDCERDFCCVAVDIGKREKVILNSGKLKNAVKASISIPGIFSPVFIDNRILVDGGVIEPLPTKAIKSLGVDFIIASSIVLEKKGGEDYLLGNENQTEDSDMKRKYCNYDSKYTGSSTNGEDIGSKHEIAIKGSGNKFRLDKLFFKRKKQDEDKKRKPSVFYILDASLNIMHREMTKNYLESADIVIEPLVGDFGFFDFIHGKEIIERGRKAAIDKIPEIKKKLRLR